MMATVTITFKASIKPWALWPLVVVCAINKYFRIRLPVSWAFKLERV